MVCAVHCDSEARSADSTWRREMLAAIDNDRAAARARLGERFPAYVPSLRIRGDAIDDDQRAIAALPTEGGLVRTVIPGYLRTADALALYEHARCAVGDVLELGSAWGLSTSVLCRAVANSGRRSVVTSIEIDAALRQATCESLERERLLLVYEGIGGDADAVLPKLAAQRRRYSFAFVDHDHRLEATRNACAHLADLLAVGAYALFHDFNDERNRSEPSAYGVFDGVCEALESGRWALVDIVGCCALARREC